MSSSHKCLSCGAPVVWAITVHGNRNPIDAEPSADGNVVLEPREDREEPNAHYVGKPKEEALFDEYEGRRYKSHFATCPHSRQWRKK